MGKKNKGPGSKKWDKKIQAEKLKQQAEIKEHQQYLVDEMKFAKDANTGHLPMKLVDELLPKSNAATVADELKWAKNLLEAGIIAPEQYTAAKTEAFKMIYGGGYSSGKSHHHLNFLDTYGKAGQVGIYAGKIDPWTGNDAVQHQWLTWMKQQMQKLHPGVTKVSISKDEAWQAVRFNVSLKVAGNNYLFVETASMELLSKTDNLEDVGHEILKRLKNKIEYDFPHNTPGMGKPGNMTVVSNPYMDANKMFIVPQDMHNDFEKYAKSYGDSKFKGLADIWLEKHKPVPPVPPEEDKKYYVTPQQAYNEALQKIEQHAVEVKNNNTTWGEISKVVAKAIKEQLAAAKLAESKRTGFSGTTVQDSLKNVLPCLYEQVKCPAPACNEGSDMANMIIHLNDGHLWSREQIADWAEALDIDISVKETK
jgi:hypothetical protein